MWSTFHVFDLHTTIKNTDTHHSEQIVSGVGVIVDTTKESSRSIGTDSSLDEVGTSRVVLCETRAIVNETVNRNQRSFLRLILEFIPANDWQVVAALWPFELLALFLQSEKFHSVLTLLDFIIGKSFEVGSQTKGRHGTNEPFGRVVLVPFDGISEIHWELMMEVVVAFSDGAKSSDEVVARGVFVVERLISEPMGQ